MKIKKISLCAIIAALYVALSFSLSFFSYSPVQIRISEAFTVIPYFGSWGIAAVTAGCLISNLISPYGILDIVFGTAATFIGAVGTHILSKHKPGLWYLAPLPPVIANTLIIPVIFCMESGVFNPGSYLIFAAQIFAGEALSCCGIGIPLIAIIRKNRKLSDYLSEF